MKDIDITKKEFGYLLGVFLGDGFLSKKKMVCLETKDLDFAQKFKESFEKICKNKSIIKKRVTRNLFSVKAYSAKLVRLFKSFENDKNEILNLSMEQKIEFVKGIFDSEGTVICSKKYNKIAIYNTDISLLNIVNKILVEFGISSKIPKQHNVGKGHFGKKCVFILAYFDRENITKIYKLIRFSILRKQEKLEQIIYHYRSMLVKERYIDLIQIRKSGMTFQKIGEKYNWSRGNAWKNWKTSYNNLQNAKNMGLYEEKGLIE